MSDLALRDDNPADPIIWQRGRVFPDGVFRLCYLRRSDEARLLQAYGREALDQMIAETEADIARWVPA